MDLKPNMAKLSAAKIFLVMHAGAYMFVIRSENYAASVSTDVETKLTAIEDTDPIAMASRFRFYFVPGCQILASNSCGQVAGTVWLTVPVYTLES